MRELQTFGLVQGHQLHAAGFLFVRTAGGEGGMIEKLARRVEAAGELHELLQVLEPPFHRFGAAFAQHAAIAGCVEQQ